jgi:anti-sigma B factor antagonist
VNGEEWSHETSHETPLCPHGTLTVTAAPAQSLPDTTVCTVTGQINRDTAPVLRDALVAARRDDNAHLVIDLSAVTSMDSAGLYTLLEARYKHDIDGGGHLAAVVAPSSRAIPDLYVVSLEATFDVHHDLAGALHACASAGPDSGP